MPTAKAATGKAAEGKENATDSKEKKSRVSMPNWQPLEKAAAAMAAVSVSEEGITTGVELERKTGLAYGLKLNELAEGEHGPFLVKKHATGDGREGGSDKEGEL